MVSGASGAVHDPWGLSGGLIYRILEIFIQDEDGARLGYLTGTGTASWNEEWPINWNAKVIFGFKIGFPLTRHGVHEFVILLNDSHIKTIPFLVVPSGPNASPVDQTAEEE